MDHEFIDRLRRLGLVKGARQLRPADDGAKRSSVMPAATSQSFTLEKLLPGGFVAETGDGACFVLDHVYPLNYRHGSDTLADLLRFRPADAARYALANRIDSLDFRDFVFLDTETTGLGGAGTLAFMVGVGFFESRAQLNGSDDDPVFVVRQYFLRDPGDERAMLRLLDDLLATRSGLITFNGRSFDVPLLDNRYLINRSTGRLAEMPHIDLLPPARRLWRARLGSCALSSLERGLLLHHRAHEDVPGWLIPTIYLNYLRTGDAGELTRVFYHNEVDMLSMVTLAARIFAQLEPTPAVEGLDLVSLARWQADMGLSQEAEATFRLALDGDLDLATYRQALLRLATLYKQTNRRDEAVVLWRQLAATGEDDVTGHIELAKYYEWQVQDIGAAISWTQQALELVNRRRPSREVALSRDELLHRLQRLESKQR